MPNFRITGRPKKYSTEKALVRAINNYFDQCDADKEPYTITGLGLAIGLGRKQIIAYGKDEQFTNAIKAAKRKVQHFLEKRVIQAGNSSGPIFLLKNLGWADKQTHEVTGKDGQDLKWEIKVTRVADGREGVKDLPPGRKGAEIEEQARIAGNPAELPKIAPLPQSNTLKVAK